MRLLAHLVVSDVRRHRRLIVLWLAVLVAATVVDGVRPVFAAKPSAATFDLLAGLLTLLRLLLRIVLIALLVQTHPLVGTDAFWLTRPIPRLTMLAAKAIVLAAFLVLAPIAAEAVLTRAYGILPGEIVRVAIDSALFAALWVSLFSTAAALTPTFARFVLLCGGVLATLALYIAISITIQAIAPSPPPPVTSAPGPQDHTGFVVLVVTLILACAVTLVVQYTRRQLWRSSLVAVVAVIVALYTADSWAWPFLQAKVVRPVWAEGEASLPIVAEPAAARPNEPGTATDSRGGPLRTVRAPVHVSGLQPGWSASIGVLQATLQLDGGRTLTSTPGFSFPTPSTTDDGKLSSSQAIRGLIGASSIVLKDDVSKPPVTATLLAVPESVFNQVAPARGHYRGRFHLQLTHYQIEATLPTRPGAEARTGSYHLAVDSARTSSGRAVLQLRESDATSNFDRRPRVERRYFLRNRRTGEAVEGGIRDVDFGILPRMLSGLTVSNASSSTGFRAIAGGVWFPPRGPLGAGVQSSEAWLRDADLVIVAGTQEAGLERSLDIDDFPLNATAPTATRSDPR